MQRIIDAQKEGTMTNRNYEKELQQIKETIVKMVGQKNIEHMYQMLELCKDEDEKQKTEYEIISSGGGTTCQHEMKYMSR